MIHMLTKGIIIGRVGSDNHYLVRIPILESANDVSRAIVEATLSYTPGIVESFKENDVVILGFENHNASNPIIVGRLFLQEDINKPRGFANLESLNVSKSVILPEDTTIGGQSLKNLPGLLDSLSNKTLYCYEFIFRANATSTEDNLTFTTRGFSTRKHVNTTTISDVLKIWVDCFGTSNEVNVSGAIRSSYFDETLIVIGVRISNESISSNNSIVVRYVLPFNSTGTTEELDATTNDIKTSDIIFAQVDNVNSFAL